MKKLVSVILLIAVLFSFASCGAKTEGESTTDANKQSQTEVKIDLNEIKNTIITENELEDPLEMEKDGFCDIYNIDESLVEEFVCVTTIAGTFPDEVIMVKATSGNAKEAIIDELNSHLEDIMVQSQNYDEENYALAQTCKVITEGDYVALFISAKHEAMEKTFLGAFNK